MLYSCDAERVAKAVKDSWSLAKGIMGNKNFNPRPKEREGERETLFLDNPGASATKIPSDALQPSDGYHKVWPLSSLSMPSHFLICNLITFLCSFVSGTDRYRKYFQSHLYEAAGLRPGTLEPRPTTTFWQSCSTQTRVLLPPSCLTCWSPASACPVCTSASPTWCLKSSPLLTGCVKQCDAYMLILSSALWGKGGFPEFSPPQFRCACFPDFLLRPCSNPVSRDFSTWIQSESDLESV